MPDDLAARILGEDASQGRFTEGGGLAIVAGFEGESGNDNVKRLYLTPDLTSAYVEFPASAAQVNPEGMEVGTDGRFLPGTAYWLPKNQDCTLWCATPLTAKKLDAPLLAETAQSLQDYNTRVANGDMGTERYVQNPFNPTTPPDSCNSTSWPPMVWARSATGTERIEPLTAIAIGSAVWGGLGALGLQDDVQKAAASAVGGAVNTVKKWFGW
jgi:hypothetical protein